MSLSFEGDIKNILRPGGGVSGYPRRGWGMKVSRLFAASLDILRSILHHIVYNSIILQVTGCLLNCFGVLDDKCYFSYRIYLFMNSSFARNHLFIVRLNIIEGTYTHEVLLYQ